MVEAVKVLPKEIQDVIEVNIWNVKQLEGIKKKKELRAKAVPSIAVDGIVVFQSGIPQHDELIAAIRERLSL
jgi:indole-3-glycerol phosphate synthase